MKVEIPCSKCREVNKVELNEEFLFHYTCSYCGSKENSKLSLEKYQVLFDLGIVCLKNGYYKEAVSDFASALERCYEFAIKMMLKKNDIDEDTFNNVWKEVKSQSERQYGAFIMLYASNIKEVFKVDKKKVEFRNNIIHKGIIPTFDETYEYAKYVYNSIYSIILNLLKNKYLDNYNPYQSNEKGKKYYKDSYITFIHHFYMYNDSSGEIYDTPNFETVYNGYYKNGRLGVAKG